MSPDQLRAFATYYQELVVWNKRVNLTTITEPAEVQLRHFLDSLTTLLAFPDSGDLVATCSTRRSVIDVGAGAGFPGVPLRIACPSLSVTLLEATSKKVAFLRHLIEVLGLQDVSIIGGRAEEIAHLPRYRESFDIVVARAVARLPVLVELCLPFTAIGGRFIAMKSGDVEPEVAGSERAIGTLGGVLREIRPVALRVLPHRPRLVIIDKISPTPLQFPRRPGIPNKRPL